MKKNPNLTPEQKLILFEEGTERPGSSELNFEKREGSYHCANCDVKLFDSKKNTRAVLVGHHFLSLCQMCSKQKRIIILVMQEPNIIVKVVAVIMVTYLRMGPNLLAKDTVIMVFVWYLNLKFNCIILKI